MWSTLQKSLLPFRASRGESQRRDAESQRRKEEQFSIFRVFAALRLCVSSPNALLNWVYPPLCLHCDTRLQSGTSSLFCPTCLDHLTLLDLEGRCSTCFLELGKKRCERCVHRKRAIHRQLAATENLGPARTLLAHVNKAEPKPIRAAASLMVYQWCRQSGPLPDAVIPLAAADLAKEVARLLGVPCLQPLKTHYSHHAFMRGGVLSRVFALKKRQEESLADRHLLLIAPLLEDELFREAALALQVGCPALIEGLSFACPVGGPGGR